MITSGLIPECGSSSEPSICELGLKGQVCMLRVRLFAIPWILAHQAPLPMAFSRQEYWSGLPALTQGLNLCLLHVLPWQAGSFTQAAQSAGNTQNCLLQKATTPGGIRFMLVNQQLN